MLKAEAEFSPDVGSTKIFLDLFRILYLPADNSIAIAVFELNFIVFLVNPLRQSIKRFKNIFIVQCFLKWTKKSFSFMFLQNS